MSKLFKNPINKAKALCTAASVATVTTATSPMVFAAPTDAMELMGKILNIIFDIFMYIGIMLLAWSIGMLVLSFKNEDADSKSRAMMLLVVSIVLIGLKALGSPILSSLGVKGLK